MKPIVLLNHPCTVVKILGGTIKLPSNPRMYDRLQDRVMLCHSPAGGGMMVMGEKVVLDFHDATTTTVNTLMPGVKMITETASSNKPLFFCMKSGLQLEYTENGRFHQVPTSMQKTMFGMDAGLDNYNTFHVREKYAASIQRGMDLIMGMRDGGTVYIAESDIVVPYPMMIGSDAHIVGPVAAVDGSSSSSSPCIIMVGTSIISLLKPMYLKLENVSMQALSSASMSDYFSSCPTRALAVPNPGIAGSNFMSMIHACEVSCRARCVFPVVILVCTLSLSTNAYTIILSHLVKQDSVVECSGCTFKVDMMICTPTMGVCVVKQASKTIFRGCRFEIMTHASFMMMPPDRVASIFSGPR